MGESPAISSSVLEWGVASVTMPGQPRSGDAHVICPFDRGVLVGVADGLGHGREAATAAERAMATLRAHPGESVIGLIRRCHQALAGTRGAVMSVASFNVVEHTVTWICVGNVQGVLVRADPRVVPRTEVILPRSGVVGLQLPMLQASVTALAPADLVVFATDGIGPGFAEHVGPGRPAALARLLLDTCKRPSDDALVVVGRYLGGDAP
jgi:hypothetical protein